MGQLLRVMVLLINGNLQGYLVFCRRKGVQGVVV